ncbi:dihydrofolate reductase [Thermoleophilia bacterium SCSIO 60948]|nr:dihydrofolate reductase [Thermoleophilia bacterium SCSIO 60948]
MSALVAEMSMSLDGFVADGDDGVAEVFAWMGDEENSAELAAALERVGAVLTGRRTSDLAGAWGGQHPAGVPTFVVSHRPPPEDLDAEATVHFVGDLEQAVLDAKAAAGGKPVGVAGGDTVRQLLGLGLLDEIRIALVPVLLGSGIRFFPDLGDAPVRLEELGVARGAGVTHLHLRVVR